MNGDFKNRSASFLTGLLFVVAGIVLNQWTIGYLRPIPRPIVELKNLAIIWAFQFICVIIGLLLIVGSRYMITEARLIAWYKNISVVIVSLIVGFIFMNLVLYGVSVIRTSLGSANPVVEKYHISPLDLYPGFTNDQYTELMKETWSRGFAYEPFTGFKEGTYQGTYVNVDANGFRHVKDQGPWPPQKTNFNIFIFGNSTTFNYGVPDEWTIASRLQEFLRAGIPGKNVAIYNFGRGFFYSSQERALYDKMLVMGYVPNAAIFIDGQTDFDFPTYGETPQFTQDIESFFSGSSYTRILGDLPIAAWGRSFFAAKNNSTTTEYVPTEKDIAMVQLLIQRYLANKKLIEAASSGFGVKAFFVWQPNRSFEYSPDIDLFQKTPNSPGAPLGYPYMAKYVAEHQMGNDFIYLADMQKTIKGPIYIDGLHYSGIFSREIAADIADAIKTKIF